MKEVLYHYVMMVKTLVPDECPTKNYDEMVQWCDDKDITPEDISHDTRDYEIVEVSKVKEDDNEIDPFG